jgi:hypothetical protein
MRQEITPVADYTVLYRAVEIDAAIGEWRLPSRDNDAGDPIGQIYKQMPQIYLWQTIYPLKSASWAPEDKIISSVKDGLSLLESFPPNIKSTRCCWYQPSLSAVLPLILHREAVLGVSHVRLKTIASLRMQI